MPIILAETIIGLDDLKEQNCLSGFQLSMSHSFGKGTTVSPEIQTHRKALSCYQGACWKKQCPRAEGTFSRQCG